MAEKYKKAWEFLKQSLGQDWNLTEEEQQKSQQALEAARKTLSQYGVSDAFQPIDLGEQSQNNK